MLSKKEPDLRLPALLFHLYKHLENSKQQFRKQIISFQRPALEEQQERNKGGCGGDEMFSILKVVVTIQLH